MNVKPLLQALVLADHVYIDQRTGKKVLAGTFNHLSVPSLPGVYDHNPYIYVALTDLHNQVELTLRLVDLGNGDVLREVGGLKLEADDPLATVEMVVELPPLTLPHEGVFAFELLAQEELIGSLRLFVSANEGRDT